MLRAVPLAASPRAFQRVGENMNLGPASQQNIFFFFSEVLSQHFSSLPLLQVTPSPL